MAKKSNSPDQHGSGILSQTVKNLSEGLTGLGAEVNEKGLLQSIGLVIQRVRGQNLVQALYYEWRRLVDLGRVNPDYEGSDQYRNCLHEIFDFLDKDIPDEARFNAIKGIFLAAASEEISTRDDFLPHQYIRLCKALSSGALTLMLAEYAFVKKQPPEGAFPRSTSATGWCEGHAANSGLGHADLVALFEEELIDKHIVNPRGPTEPRQIIITERGRLTDLGWGVCEFIAHSDRLFEESET